MIDLDCLWKQYKRIIKKNGCIALWAQAPFSHVLALSNIKQYRYEWVIEKTKGTGHLNAKKMPMKSHENVMIFSDLDESPETIQIFYGKLPTYNPQMTDGHEPVHSYTKHTTDGSCYGDTKLALVVEVVRKDIRGMYISSNGIHKNQVYIQLRNR